MVYLEFVVVGVPISNQGSSLNLQNWRATVEAEARKHWNKSVLAGNLKGVLINFHLGYLPSWTLKKN